MNERKYRQKFKNGQRRYAANYKQHRYAQRVKTGAKTKLREAKNQKEEKD